MKVIVWKVPYTIKRNGQEVNLEMHEDRKEELRVEDAGDDNDITKIATDLAVGNDKERLLAKATLLANEQESTGFLTLKILS